MSCNVTVRREQKRLYVKAHKDEALVKFFRTSPKYYFDYKSKEWSFSSSHLDALCEFLEASGLTYKITDERVPMIIEVEDGIMHMHLTTHIDGYEQMKELKGFNYDNVERIIKFNAT